MLRLDSSPCHRRSMWPSVFAYSNSTGRAQTASILIGGLGSRQAATTAAYSHRASEANAAFKGAGGATISPPRSRAASIASKEFGQSFKDEPATSPIWFATSRKPRSTELTQSRQGRTPRHCSPQGFPSSSRRQSLLKVHAFVSNRPRG